MRTLRRLVAVSCLVAASALPAFAVVTLWVDDNCTPPGSGTLANPYCTIQDAANAAHDGYRLLVRPGTYTQPVVLEHFVTLESQGGAAVTALDFPGSGIGIRIPDLSPGVSDPRSVRVRGFTIRDAVEGIRSEESLDLSDSILEAISGTAVLLGDGRHRIEDTQMTDCGCLFGVSLGLSGDLAIERLRVSGAVLAAIDIDGGATIRNLLAHDNGGAAVTVGSTGSLELAFATLTNSGVGVAASSPDVAIDHSIVWANAADVNGVGCSAFTNSDIGGIDCTGGGNNLRTDPVFANPAGANYDLTPFSPVVDRGLGPETFADVPCDDVAGATRFLDGDADGLARADMGALELVNLARLATEVTGLVFASRTTMTWAHTQPSYNVYRGALSDLGYSNFGSCRTSNVSPATFIDTAVPQANRGFFYLVTGRNPSEGTLGVGSCAERSNFNACP